MENATKHFLLWPPAAFALDGSFLLTVEKIKDDKLLPNSVEAMNWAKAKAMQSSIKSGKMGTYKTFPGLFCVFNLTSYSILHPDGTESTCYSHSFCLAQVVRVWASDTRRCSVSVSSSLRSLSRFFLFFITMLNFRTN